jgi:hypothetical protein
MTITLKGSGAAAASSSLTITAKTTTYTITTDDDVVTGDSSGGAFSFTLPTAVGNSGKVYHIKKIDSSANAVTIDGDGTETIDGATTRDLLFQYDSISIVSDNANWNIL